MSQLSLKNMYFHINYIFHELKRGVLMLQGKKNPGTDLQTVKGFLDQLNEAKVMKVDRLVINSVMKGRKIM